MYQYIGVDVSNQTLQVFDGLRDLTFPNEPKLKEFNLFVREWKKKIKQREASGTELVIIFEPTGPYSSHLREYCSKKELKAHIMNPMQSSYFAKASGNRSKTDPIDARMLYSYHIMLNNKECLVPVLSEHVKRLSSYLKSYQLLIKTETAFQNHYQSTVREGSASKPLRKILEAGIQQIQQEKDQVLKELISYIKADLVLAESYRNLCSIPGVGPLSSINLLILFLKFPTANRNQLTSLAGLDPTVKTSGTSLNKKPRISKRGNSLLRKTLYCAAISGVQCNPDLTKQYELLQERKKPKKVALVAIMRQILLTAHALYMEKRKYEVREDKGFKNPIQNT
ncbi:MAG TPA: IS110 family transposase [Caldisericia bacterium]|nr:IS110 family transposase [Caldisericia bacterium]